MIKGYENDEIVEGMIKASEQLMLGKNDRSKWLGKEEWINVTDLLGVSKDQ